MGSYNKNHRFTGIQIIYIRLTRCCCLLYKDDLPSVLFGGFKFVLCFLLTFFPSWTSRGFEAQPNSPLADDLASKRPCLEICFQIQISFERRCVISLFFFFMGSPSMHFIKCYRWPIMICKRFVFSRRTSSFK